MSLQVSHYTKYIMTYFGLNILCFC